MVPPEPSQADVLVRDFLPFPLEIRYSAPLVQRNPVCRRTRTVRNLPHPAASSPTGGSAGPSHPAPRTAPQGLPCFQLHRTCCPDADAAYPARKASLVPAHEGHRQIPGSNTARGNRIAGRNRRESRIPSNRSRLNKGKYIEFTPIRKKYSSNGAATALTFRGS